MGKSQIAVIYYGATGNVRARARRGRRRDRNVERARRARIGPSAVGALGVVIPLIGARTLAQVEDNLASLELALDDEHLAKLDAASSPEPIFPHSMLQSELIRNLRTSAKEQLLDVHRS